MTTQNMPVLALRGLTAFPGQTLSFDAEREISILALENAMEGDRELLLVTQREIGVQDPQEEDLYEIGTVCRIFQIVKTSDTGVRVIAGGLHRAALRRLWQTKPFLQANVELLEDQSWRASDRTEALTRRTYALFGQYQELVGNLSDQLVASAGHPGPRPAGGHHRRQHQPPAPGSPAGAAGAASRPAAAGDERNSGA